jgi:DNA ligase (NAD+)
MDIEGLGDKLVDQLVDAQVVRVLPDLYRLGLSSLAALDRMAEKSAQNVLAALKNPRAPRCSAFCLAWAFAMWANPRPGSGQAFRQARRHHGRQRGGVAASQGCRAGGGRQHSHLFAQPHNREVVEQLRACGVHWEEGEPAEKAPQILAGLTVVLTGTLPTLGRDAAKDMLEAAGAKVSGSVSKRPAMWSQGRRRAASWPRPRSWACPCWTKLACWLAKGRAARLSRL